MFFYEGYTLPVPALTLGPVAASAQDKLRAALQNVLAVESVYFPQIYFLPQGRPCTATSLDDNRTTTTQTPGSDAVSIGIGAAVGGTFLVLVLGLVIFSMLKRSALHGSTSGGEGNAKEPGGASKRYRLGENVAMTNLSEAPKGTKIVHGAPCQGISVLPDTKGVKITDELLEAVLAGDCERLLGLLRKHIPPPDHKSHGLHLPSEEPSIIAANRTEPAE